MPEKERLTKEQVKEAVLGRVGARMTVAEMAREIEEDGAPKLA